MKVSVYKNSLVSGLRKVIIDVSDDNGSLLIRDRMFGVVFVKLFTKRLERRILRAVEIAKIFKGHSTTI